MTTTDPRTAAEEALEREPSGAGCACDSGYSCTPHLAATLARAYLAHAYLAAPAPDARDGVPDPVRDALVLAIGESRAVLTWGERIKPRGWRHISGNLLGLLDACETAMTALAAARVPK